MLDICVVLHLSRPVEEPGKCSAQSFPVKWPKDASRMCVYLRMTVSMDPSSFGGGCLMWFTVIALVLWYLYLTTEFINM